MTQTDHLTPADLGLHGWVMEATDIDGGTHYVDEVRGYHVDHAHKVNGTSTHYAVIQFRAPGLQSMSLPIPLRRIKAVHIP